MSLRFLSSPILQSAVSPRSLFVLRSQKKAFSPTLYNVRDMTILSKQSGEEYKKQNYNERMSKTGRPVSPHVTIYQFPIGALTSITNRITGVALSVGCLGVASLELVSSGMTQQVFSDLAMSGGGGPFLGGMAKFAVGFPLVYHYLGGVRHLIWDTFPDKYLNNVSVEKTSYVLVGGSLVLSVGLAVLV